MRRTAMIELANFAIQEYDYYFLYFIFHQHEKVSRLKTKAQPNCLRENIDRTAMLFSELFRKHYIHSFSSTVSLRKLL